MQVFVHVVSGEGFGDNENAWETCGVYTTHQLAEKEIAVWREEEPSLNYKIEAFPLNT